MRPQRKMPSLFRQQKEAGNSTVFVPLPASYYIFMARTEFPCRAIRHREWCAGFLRSLRSASYRNRAVCSAAFVGCSRFPFPPSQSPRGGRRDRGTVPKGALSAVSYFHFASLGSSVIQLSVIHDADARPALVSSTAFRSQRVSCCPRSGRCVDFGTVPRFAGANENAKEKIRHSHRMQTRRDFRADACHGQPFEKADGLLFRRGPMDKSSRMSARQFCLFTGQDRA